MQRVLIYICILTLVSACGPTKEVKQKKELEKLALEVMEVHDRSMPHTTELFGLKKKLVALHDSFISIHNKENEKDTVARHEMMEAVVLMDEADERMMDWMHHYTAPADYLPFEEKKQYYLDQKKLIEEIEQLTNESIRKAKELIEKYSSK